MRVQYLGFAGRDNLGDDAIRAALKERMTGIELVDVPVGYRALVTDGYRHWRRARHAPLVLGGGTVLGRTLWRRHVAVTQRLFHPAAWEMIGAGVEDPDFVGDRSYTSWQEIATWTRILPRFRRVTVRGPRSAEILGAQGIEASVVGDPALLLQRPALPEAGRQLDLLVNATCGEDQWGGTGTDWTSAVAEALIPLINAGLSVEFVSMEPTDDAWNTRLAREMGVRPVVHHPARVEEFFNLAGGARVVLGTRLHCNILAAACGTPNVALEYRPKCRDFMASVDMEDFCHRVDRIDPSLLRADIEHLLSGWHAVSGKLISAVGELSRRLRRELSDVTAALSGVGET